MVAISKFGENKIQVLQLYGFARSDLSFPFPLPFGGEAMVGFLCFILMESFSVIIGLVSLMLESRDTTIESSSVKTGGEHGGEPRNGRYSPTVPTKFVKN